MATLRSKNFATLCYEESSDFNQVVFALESLHISFLVSPLHDSDFSDDGNPKKPHWHIILVFDSLKSVSQVKDLLSGVSQGLFVSFVGCEIVNSLVSYARYLCHLDDSDKARYETSAVIQHGLDYVSLVTTKSDYLSSFIHLVDYVYSNNVMSFADLVMYARFNDADMLHTILHESFTVREFIRSFAQTRSVVNSSSSEDE